MIDISEWVKIFMSHVNCHQWVTSAEQDLNNQEDRMTYSLKCSLLPQPFLPFTNKLMNKVARAAVMEILPGLSNVHFYLLKVT